MLSFCGTRYIDLAVVFAAGLVVASCGQDNGEVAEEAEPVANAIQEEVVDEPVVSTIQQPDDFTQNPITALRHNPEDTGEDLFQRGFYDEAIEQWRADAEAGDAYSAYRLGVQYFDAQHVDQDFEMSARYHQLASELGHPAAMFDLATYYEDGRGVAVDIELAAQWYLEAARRGFPPAQHNVATLFEEGVGVDQDLVQAFLYYSLAIEQGFRVNFVQDEITGESVFLDPRDYLRDRMTAEDIAEAEAAVEAFSPVE